jgi:N-acetylgalactosamine kinase
MLAVGYMLPPMCRFNLRVLECRLAAMHMAKRLQLLRSSGSSSSSSGGRGSSTGGGPPQVPWQQVTVLKQLEAWMGHSARATLPGGPDFSPTEALASYADSTLPREPQTFAQVADALQLSQQQLLDLLPPSLQEAAAAAALKLQDRALHVLQEASRVRACVSLCSTASLSDADKLQQLGALMNASHASCAGLYECSCEELDKLVDAARAAGALGARLTGGGRARSGGAPGRVVLLCMRMSTPARLTTLHAHVLPVAGAGWGGCTVSLVREQDAPKFMAQLRESYFMPLVAAGVVTEAELPQCLFATKPSSGAAVMRLSLAAAEPEAAACTAAAAAAGVV